MWWSHLNSGSNHTVGKISKWNGQEDLLILRGSSVQSDWISRPLDWVSCPIWLDIHTIGSGLLPSLTRYPGPWIGTSVQSDWISGPLEQTVEWIRSTYPVFLSGIPSEWERNSCGDILVHLAFPPRWNNTFLFKSASSFECPVQTSGWSSHLIRVLHWILFIPVGSSSHLIRIFCWIDVVI